MAAPARRSPFRPNQLRDRPRLASPLNDRERESLWKRDCSQIGMKKIAEVFDVDRRTVERWGQWWRDMSSKSGRWRERLGRLTASDEPAPRRFILAFDAFEDPGKQSSLMRFFADGVASTSTSGAGRLDVRMSTQKMPAVSP